MSLLQAFTLFHVALSLIGILSGFVVAFGMLSAMRLQGWTKIFLVTTVATSLTGYLFPVQHVMPSHVVGVISLVVLAIAIFALYGRHLTGNWRWIYVATAMMGQYLNFFVLIVQAFLKIPALHAMAPTQTEPPFKLAQLVALLFFVVLTVAAAIRFRVGPKVPSPV